MNETPLQLWAADPHRFGPGKVHYVDYDDPGKTFCGKVLTAIPGRPIARGQATCLICLSAPAKRAERKRISQDWEKQRRVEAERWRLIYEAHLNSDKWRDIRGRVMERAQGICEGCRRGRAAQVHHLTYLHLGDEFLWELVAVCLDCHKRAHPDKNP